LADRCIGVAASSPATTAKVLARSVKDRRSLPAVVTSAPAGEEWKALRVRQCKAISKVKNKIYRV